MVDRRRRFEYSSVVYRGVPVPAVTGGRAGLGADVSVACSTRHYFQLLPDRSYEDTYRTIAREREGRIHNLNVRRSDFDPGPGSDFVQHL